jgi:hypothetical protein
LEVSNSARVYVPCAGGIWTLDRLMLQIKYEFNANNRRLYTDGALLAAGKS